MVGTTSSPELLIVGPRLVGVPKVKSAFATSAARPNAKTNTTLRSSTSLRSTRIAKIFVVFIFFSFQKIVDIFVPHTVRSFVHSSSFAEEPAFRTRWSYSYKREKEGNLTICLKFFSRIGIICIISVIS
jgi:hypothetical protein